MADRYSYDKYGNYKGRSSSTPPSSGGCLGFIIVFVIALCLYKCQKPPIEIMNKPVPSYQSTK